ncbi:lytic transglycosylase [Tropicibacter sp. R16_0]|uniref:transglycosylase SLT domain-containing protein n=1 Tax=Tropicibacter sp. R16_0 TaxID=2821102 RepID=UPI001ADCF492|nr:lytic transglycosylase [Tropicibacter sp. R16_0]MBO9450611.1 lytic transglycosylase [Tropicibacter sp. R16_0]
MSRSLCVLMVVLLVAACGGGSKSPPRNLDNACSIAKQRPEYIKAFKKTERKWGVPVHVQMATIYQESRYRSDARTPHKYVLGVLPMGRQSSAFGYSQALDGTWDQYKKETGNRRARRDRMRDASDFIGWYMAKSNSRNGIAMTDTRNQYLAYHDGHTGYARGTYRSKSWLLRTADQVAARGEMYRKQLNTCGRFKY